MPLLGRGLGRSAFLPPYRRLNSLERLFYVKENKMFCLQLPTRETLVHSESVGWHEEHCSPSLSCCGSSFSVVCSHERALSVKRQVETLHVYSWTVKLPPCLFSHVDGICSDCVLLLHAEENIHWVEILLTHTETSRDFNFPIVFFFFPQTHPTIHFIFSFFPLRRGKQNLCLILFILPTLFLTRGLIPPQHINAGAPEGWKHIC